MLLYILLIRYTNIGECSDGLLLTIHYIIAGIFIALIWYVKKSVKLLIKKMVDYKKALVAILENTLENVNAGNTNITEEEASVIIDHLTMLNKGVATVSKAYACEHVLHITSNKFDYLVRKGIIPHGRKRLGFNELSWVLKDLDEAKRYLANNKD